MAMSAGNPIGDVVCSTHVSSSAREEDKRCVPGVGPTLNAVRDGSSHLHRRRVQIMCACSAVARPPRPRSLKFYVLLVLD